MTFELCAAGTTTVFDSLIVGAVGNPERRGLLPLMLKGLGEARRHGLLRADHLLHLRCDAREHDLIELFLEYADQPELRFVTIMDDGPRRDPKRFRHLERRKNTPAAEIEAAIAAVATTEDCTEENRRRLVAHCRARGVPFASHDDTTVAHITEAVGYGLGFRISNYYGSGESRPHRGHDDHRWGTEPRRRAVTYWERLGAGARAGRPH
ncbi:alpha-D-ribose 1-methylphosphonate 5-triphosphate diphosphatase PhnM [Bradyrhizobium sp. i1.3.1]